ncbi:MAG TPA: hypothetical protein DCL63_05085, partial [Firmicutes bacterium]|nr:hypothetical protein [Bacillota bacterium]
QQWQRSMKQESRHLSRGRFNAETPRSLALAFMGCAKTDSAKQAIECVDRLAEEYLWQLKIARVSRIRDLTPLQQYPTMELPTISL